MAQENAATDTEGTVQWDAAADFLTGKMAEAEAAEGEGAEESAAQETPPTPEYVEVSIRGKKVRMTAEAAEAYQEIIRDQRERDGRLGGEVQSLREMNARLQGQIEALAPIVKPKGPTPPDPELAEKDFTEYHRQMVKYADDKAAFARAEALDAIEERERTRSTSETQEAIAERWVGEFYTRHAHLNDPAKKDVVQLVYNRNRKEIDRLRESGADRDAQDRLAELADEHIVALRAGSKQTNNNKPPRLEGRGTPPARTPAAPPKEEDFSASSWVRAKRAALRGDKSR